MIGGGGGGRGGKELAKESNDEHEDIQGDHVFQWEVPIQKEYDDEEGDPLLVEDGNEEVEDHDAQEGDDLVTLP